MIDKWLKILINNIQHYAQGKSNYALSKESGVSNATLSRLFSEQSIPNLEVIVKISEALKVKPADLLRDNSQATIPPDLVKLLENQSPVVYDTIRAMLISMNKNK